MTTNKVLITGANGMVGRNLREHVKAKSYELLVPNSQDLNLLDRTAIETYLGQHNPDIVIHAAGRVGGIQANIQEPVHFLVDNLDMGRNLIMAARETKIRHLLNLGSSCMYPRNAQNPLTENSILQGELEPTNEGYAIAKIAVAKLCEYISRESDEFHYKTLIPCNLYGRHDKFSPHHSHMIAAIIHKLHEAKMVAKPYVHIWGDGKTRREFMYASDLADCVWQCIEDFNSIPSLMNVGIGEDHSVYEYYHEAAKVVGYNGVFKHDLTKPSGMKQKLVCSNKVNSWGWVPRTTLSQGLKHTYDFYLRENQQ